MIPLKKYLQVTDNYTEQHPIIDVKKHNQLFKRAK